MFKHLFNPTSIFKDLFESSSRSMSIKTSVYNRLLKKLDFQVDYNLKMLVPVNHNFGDMSIYHITDERLSEIIYIATKRELELPNEFIKLKFITVDSKKKAVFIMFEPSGHLASYYSIHDHISAIIPNLVCMADMLSDTFSTENSKIYLNYNRLFELFVTARYDFMSAWLASISFESRSILDINEIVETILSHFNCWYTLQDMRYDNEKVAISNFYVFVKRGIFIGEKVDRYNSMPMKLFANILKYALNPDSFTCLQDLFKYNETFAELSIEDDSIIFDEELFAKSFSYMNETDDFIIRNDETRTALKLKDSAKSKKLESIISTLFDCDLLVNTNILHSSQGDIYFLIESDDSYNSLKTYIHSIANREDELLSLITTAHSLLSSFSEPENLRFRDDTDFLDCLCVCPNKDIVFSNLSSLSFSKDDLTFDYRKVIMIIIREYMNCSSIDVNNIYSCEFIKLLHPHFTRSLIEYLDSGVYQYESIIDESDEILSDSYASQIEFVENLPLNDADVLSKLSFFEGVELPEELTNALCKQREADNKTATLSKDGFISLDESLSYITSCSLNKENMENIFSNSVQEYFLLPEKVIITRETTSDGTYRIIGVMWNHTHLYNAFDLIEHQGITCKEVYIFIYHLLVLGARYNYNIAMMGPLDNYLYIDSKDYKPVLSPHTVENRHSVNRYHDGLITYYQQILNILSYSANFDDNYIQFDFAEMVPEYGYYSIDKQCDIFMKTVVGIMQCDVHKHWHLPKHMCPDCKTSFQIVDRCSLNSLLYKDQVASFYTTHEFADTIYTFSSKKMAHIVKQVQIGIEHDLFNRFNGLIPQKILCRSFEDYKQNITCGIMYNSCNFSNIIDLSTFKNIQRLKVVLVMYKKLLPYILNGQFISTDSKIFETMVMHKDFKGDILIPNLTLMDCDAIIKVNKTKIKKTKKLFAEFLTNYIMTDDYLSSRIKANESYFVDILKDIKYLNFSEDIIRNCLGAFKNYCLTHMLPFTTKDKFCAMCKKDGVVEAKTVFEGKAYFEDLEQEEPAYDGGEANIYPCGSNEALKIFKSHVDLSFKSKILSKALKKNPLIEKFNKEHEDIQIISVKEILYKYEDNVLQLKGFFQDFVEDSYKISSLKDKEFVKEHGYRRKDIVEILMKVCIGIEFLHSIGGFIGDLNGGNILIKGKAIYIIDIDGMSFDEVKNCVYTNTYIYPPSAENNNITMQDDWYSLAVQAFYYLTYAHPFRGICDSDNVPDNETERMKLGLSVLGEHQIVPPSISIGWDFIPENLLKYFLDTFEGNRRESMLEILQSYHSYLKKVELMFTEIKRERPVSCNLNEYAYIDTDYNFIYKEKVLTNVGEHYSARIGKNGILIESQNTTYFFDTVTEKLCTLNKMYTKGPTSFCNGNIYYTSQDQQTLFVDELNINSTDISSHSIRKVTTDKVLALSVTEKNKFVFVEDNVNQKTFDIYCNSTKVYSVNKNDIFSTSGDVNVGIAYDMLSKKWIVRFTTETYTFGVVIKNDSKRTFTFKIDKALGSRVVFYGNVLYCPTVGKIYYYNINTAVLKSMECEHARLDSFIERYDNKLIVLNSDSAHMYVKS